VAQRPDGKPAGVDKVAFTRPAAERIAKVVRTVESGRRDAEGYGQGYRLQMLQRPVFRMATFTGAWSINALKTVTLKYVTTTPNTASVRNILINLPDAGEPRNCAIAKEGAAWHLINWQWDVRNAATAATLTTSELRFDTLPFGALATASTVVFNVPIISCATSTASP
jgi:hypothetical protein